MPTLYPATFHLRIPTAGTFEILISVILRPAQQIVRGCFAIIIQPLWGWIVPLWGCVVSPDTLHPYFVFCRKLLRAQPATRYPAPYTVCRLPSCILKILYVTLSPLVLVERFALIATTEKNAKTDYSFLQSTKLPIICLTYKRVLKWDIYLLQSRCRRVIPTR